MNLGFLEKIADIALTEDDLVSGEICRCNQNLKQMLSCCYVLILSHLAKALPNPALLFSERGVVHLISRILTSSSIVSAKAKSEKEELMMDEIKSMASALHLNGGTDLVDLSVSFLVTLMNQMGSLPIPLKQELIRSPVFERIYLHLRDGSDVQSRHHCLSVLEQLTTDQSDGKAFFSSADQFEALFDILHQRKLSNISLRQDKRHM